METVVDRSAGAVDKEARKVPRGCLAAWQTRRVMAHVEENLHDTISIARLAALVRLSSCQFSGVFKRTFGVTTHAWLMRRRIQVAQGLMLTTDDPLSQIALTCGMFDQSHFTRVFRQWLGETPSSWRRKRRVQQKRNPTEERGRYNTPTVDGYRTATESAHAAG
ncbi:MAG: helix-turn-helix transcriptional regulator [Acetobacteraceae bacterium]|nr:helix-turn-helix transcriptional regulator [Acetobacteraceae bacterium]